MTHDQQIDTPENQQIEHINLTHDHLCIDYGLIGQSTSDCECEWIAAIREDERRRWDGQSVVLASTIKQEGEQG